MGFSTSILDVKRFILATLSLEDLQVEDLADDTPLFEEGLGLDSIDTLELAVALRKHYGVKLGEDASLREQLSTPAALAAFLATAPRLTD